MLVYPNQRWYKEDLGTTWNLSPYGICLLATMLQDRYEVNIVDAQFKNLSQNQFRSEIEKFMPDCVGISVLTSEYAPILNITSEIVKKVNKDITVIAGGVHVTTQYVNVMKNKDIDYGVRGEGEYVLKEILDYLSGEGPFPDRGLIYRKENGEIIALPPDYIQDLDSLPVPDFELVDYLSYATKKPRYGIDTPNVFPYARILTSRGCSFGCSFCQVKIISGEKWRYRSAKNVVDELVFLKERYGIKAFVIEDDNAFINKKRTKEMLRLIKEKNLNLKWKVSAVPIFKMDEETFQLMAETGCEMIGVAVESGVERILKQIIKKPVNLKVVPELIKTAQKYGLFVSANFIIGFPGETWHEIRQTLHYADTCNADYCKIFAAQPLIGTELFKIAKEQGCLIGDEKDVGWRYGRIKSPEFTPKDISILRAYEWDRINFTDPGKLKKTANIMGISVKELNEIRKRTRDNLSIG